MNLVTLVITLVTLKLCQSGLQLAGSCQHGFTKLAKGFVGLSPINMVVDFTEIS
jgi:hypothetical protein